MSTVDERWLAEWIAFGISAFEDYLAKHASFDAYLRRDA